jgi:spore maturation protein CgeB
MTQETRRPRILISYWFGDHTIPLGAAMADGFRELGFEVSCFNTWSESWVYRFLLKPASRIARGLGFKDVDFSRDSRWGRYQYRQRMFRQKAENFAPDVLLIIHGHVVEAGILQDLKCANPQLLTIGWWVENPRDDNRPLLEQVSLYDHYFCIHRYNYDPGLGIKYLPAVAVDRKRYRRIEPPLPRDRELVFVGSWYPKRERFLATIADLPLTIYGPIWEKECSDPRLLKCLKGRSIWGERLLELYNRSKVVINISIWDTKRETLNLRTLDVPATGALLLTDDSTTLRELLTPGTEVATYNTPEELRAQALYYLRQDNEREHIAEAGYARTQALGTYADKARSMLAMAGWPPTSACLPKRRDG